MKWKNRRKPKKVIEQDDDLALISYYLERGFTPEYILNADEHTKMLLSASAMYNIELRVERENLQYKALGLIKNE